MEPRPPDGHSQVELLQARAMERNTPWLDKHVFGPMAWSNGWKSAVKFTDTILPCLRRITWWENL